MRFTTTLLSEPVRVKLPGQRSQALSVAVLDRGTVLAMFRDERKADNYARRLNAWEREARSA